MTTPIYNLDKDSLPQTGMLKAAQGDRKGYWTLNQSGGYDFTPGENLSMATTNSASPGLSPSSGWGSLFSALMGNMASGVASGANSALTRTLLNQIDPGRPARFEQLPTSPFGVRQAELMDRLKGQEGEFAALRNKPLGTTPEEVLATTLPGIAGPLERRFFEQTAPQMQNLFAQSGAGRSGQQPVELTRLYREGVGDPVAEASARIFENARQFNESQLLQRFLGSLLPQQVAASVKGEERDILGYPAEKSLYDQTEFARMLTGLMGGRGTAGMAGGAQDPLNLLLQKGLGYLTGKGSELIGGDDVWNGSRSAMSGPAGDDFWEGSEDMGSTPGEALTGESEGGEGFLSQAGSTIFGGLAKMFAPAAATAAAPFVASGIGAAAPAMTAAAPAAEAAMASFAPAAAASGAGAGLGAGVTGGMFDAAATSAGLLGAGGGLTALGGATVLAAPAAIGLLAREYAPYAHEALNSINPSRLIGGSTRATPQEAGEGNMQTLANVFNGATGTPVNVMPGGGLQASSPEAEQLFRQMWSEAQASGIPVGPELNRWAMQWLAQRGYRDSSMSSD